MEEAFETWALRSKATFLVFCAFGCQPFVFWASGKPKAFDGGVCSQATKGSQLCWYIEKPQMCIGLTVTALRPVPHTPSPE